MPIIDYKCPNCGSGMVFDSETGMLSCHSCGRNENIQDSPDPLKVHVFSEGEATEYHCKSCGAVVMTESETTATTCSFCGSVVVLGDRLTGELAPLQVIPFAISKEEAVQAFRKWCRKGLLVPNEFMAADRIKGITGMYVPFWLYDIHNAIEVHAHGKRVRTYEQGDYRYTETRHYDVYRRIRLNYVNVPIDASEKMNDQLMDRLEPFPYDQLKSFNTAYLAGYVAEKYSYDYKELFPRAQDKISDYIDSYISSTVSQYTSVSFSEKNIHAKCRDAKYTLLPVWVVHYDYKNLEYTFAMNGQTGKVVGKPPISKLKVLAWFAGISGVSFLSLKLVTWMMGGGLG